MMKRAKGATLAEIMETTGWQAHTIRGFVSLLGSKGGEKVESSKNAAGERSYRIAKEPAPALFFSPRRRNLWVTDTLQWRPEARLAQPANPMRDSTASAFCRS